MAEAALPDEGVAAPTPPATGPEHRAVTSTAPNKAFWRTVLQVGPAAALALLGILPPLLTDLLENFGHQLPPGIYSFLAATAAGLTLVAAVLARIMANPAVIAWTRQYAPFFAPIKK